MLRFKRIYEVFGLLSVRYLTLSMVIVLSHSSCQKTSHPLVAGSEVRYPDRFGPRLTDTMPRGDGGCKGDDCDIIITMYTDYGHAYSRLQSQALTELLEKYQGRIVVRKKDYLSPESAAVWRKAASNSSSTAAETYLIRASICANEQRAYWPISELLEENHSISSHAELQQVLENQKKVSLNIPVFFSCMENDATIRAALAQVESARTFGVDRSPFLLMEVVYRNADKSIKGRAEVALAGAVYSSQEIENEFVTRIPEETVAGEELALIGIGYALKKVLYMPASVAANSFQERRKRAGVAGSELRDVFWNPSQTVNILNRYYLACLHLDNKHPHTSFGLAGGDWDFARDSSATNASLSGYKVLEGSRQGNFFQITNVASLEALYQSCRRSLPQERILRGIFVTNRYGEVRLAPAIKALDDSVNQPFSRMVVFGDSLSDTGNFQYYNKFLPNQPYWGGNFSSGPTWTIHFGKFLNLPVLNQAFGGSTSIPVSVDKGKTKDYIKYLALSKLSGNMTAVVNSFVANNTSAVQNARTLFSLWIGGNDYLKWLETPAYTDLLLENIANDTDEYFERATEEVILAVGQNLNKLYGVGARNFIVFPVPDISLSPLCQREAHEFVQMCGKLVAMHQEKLERLFVDFQKNHPDANMILVPINAILSKILLEGQRLEVIANKEPCYNGYYGFEELSGKKIETCGGDSSKVAFFDEVHPTKKVHCFIAAYTLEEVRKQWTTLKVDKEWNDLEEDLVPYCLGKDGRSSKEL